MQLFANVLPEINDNAPLMARPRNRIRRLEVLRGLASMYVILYHADFVSNGIIKKLFFSFGQEAVMLFFVLSGFVIYYSISSSKTVALSAKTYLVHRFRRIYPIFLFAFVLSVLVSVHIGGDVADYSLGRIVGHLLMLQDISVIRRGVWVDVVSTNGPFWSLSYEWWFYMLFLLFLVLGWEKKQNAWVRVLILSCLGALSYTLYPNQISLWLGYFYLWWVGVELARDYVALGAINTARQICVLSGLLFLFGAWWINLLFSGDRLISYLPRDPYMQLRHIIDVGILCVCGLVWSRFSFIGFYRILGIFEKFAPISFAMYVLHAPLLALTNYHFPTMNPFFRLAIVFLPLILLCYMLEVKLQPKFNRWIGYLLRS